MTTRRAQNRLKKIMTGKVAEPTGRVARLEERTAL
jgi:hypothetical protein